MAKKKQREEFKTFILVLKVCVEISIDLIFFSVYLLSFVTGTETKKKALRINQIYLVDKDSNEFVKHQDVSNWNRFW